MLLAAGCGFTPETNPSISATSPSNGATNIATNTTITAIFNLAMNSTTINTSTFTLMEGTTPGNPITGTVTYTTGTATFTPSAPLVHNTTYTATITTGVQNVNGDAMTGNYSWVFTTGSGAGAKFSIFTSTGGAFSAGAAFDKTRNKYLAGIRGDAAGPNNIAARRMDGFGNISSSISLNSTGGTPAVAFDGTKSLVVWSDANGIKGAKIDSANAVTLLPDPISSAAGTTIGTQSVLCNSLECAVAWKDNNGTGYTNSISSYSACQLAGAHTITGTSTSAGDISIASDGNTYFAAWDTGMEIRGSIVTKCGMQDINNNFLIAAKSQSLNCTDHNPVSVAFDGTNYLVVWNDHSDCATVPKSDILAQYIDSFGNRVNPTSDVSPFQINTTNTWRAARPSIAFDGTNYLVVWTDGRNDADKNGICESTEGTCDDVYGQYLSKSGKVVGSEFVINNDAGNQIGFVTGFNAGSYFLTINSGVTQDSQGISSGIAIFGLSITP